MIIQSGIAAALAASTAGAHQRPRLLRHVSAMMAMVTAATRFSYGGFNANRATGRETSSPYSNAWPYLNNTLIIRVFN